MNVHRIKLSNHLWADTRLLRDNLPSGEYPPNWQVFADEVDQALSSLNKWKRLNMIAAICEVGVTIVFFMSIVDVIDIPIALWAVLFMSIFVTFVPAYCMYKSFVSTFERVKAICVVHSLPNGVVYNVHNQSNCFLLDMVISVENPDHV